MYFICFTCMFCAEDVISPRRKLGMYWPLDPTPGDWVGEPKLIGSGEFMIIFFQFLKTLIQKTINREKKTSLKP